MGIHDNLNTVFTVATVIAIIMGEFIPPQILGRIRCSLYNAFRRMAVTDVTIMIAEFNGLTFNHMFAASDVYLGTIISDHTHSLKVNKPDPDEDELALTVDATQLIVDVHCGVEFTWIRGNRCFQLILNKTDRDYALRVYLPYVLTKAKEIKASMRAKVRLHTVDCSSHDCNGWTNAVLNHPATICTMAMDPDTKKELIEDLDTFVKGKDYYRRVGRAWKRGYLLYGPPGTGKSSLVAAMANYLKFDIFDLDLKGVKSNSHLRTLLMSASNRSILVLEDIDCTVVSLLNRDDDDDDACKNNANATKDDKITLSGLLNLIDGLWSCCGEERIIVFTTNHKERLDPALLRPGRMDVHLEMSYCTFNGFKVLASNYLGVDNHPLFPEIEELLSKFPATPAEIAGELMKSHRDVDAALLSLTRHLRHKIRIQL